MSVKGNSMKSRPNTATRRKVIAARSISYSNSRNSDDVHINSLYLVF